MFWVRAEELLAIPFEVNLEEKTIKCVLVDLWQGKKIKPNLFLVDIIEILLTKDEAKREMKFKKLLPTEPPLLLNGIKPGLYPQATLMFLILFSLINWALQSKYFVLTQPFPNTAALNVAMQKYYQKERFSKGILVFNWNWEFSLPRRVPLNIPSNLTINKNLELIAKNTLLKNFREQYAWMEALRNISNYEAMMDMLYSIAETNGTQTKIGEVLILGIISEPTTAGNKSYISVKRDGVRLKGGKESFFEFEKDPNKPVMIESRVKLCIADILGMFADDIEKALDKRLQVALRGEDYPVASEWDIVIMSQTVVGALGFLCSVYSIAKNRGNKSYYRIRYLEAAAKRRAALSTLDKKLSFWAKSLAFYGEIPY